MVSTLVPTIWFRIHWRAAAYTPSDRNTASVSDENWPSEKMATNSRSSDVATVLMPASSANSRSTCLLRDRNGTSSSSEAKNTYQTTEPMTAMLCGTPGCPAETATPTVTSSSVPAAMPPKRRITAANGLASMRYDQLSTPSAAAPSSSIVPWAHHHTPGSIPICTSSSTPSATAQPPAAMRLAPGTRRGCSAKACTQAAAAHRSKASRGISAWLLAPSGQPRPRIDSIAMNSSEPAWHSAITR